MHVPIETVEVIAPNFKKRLSGVTSTIVQLIPLQRRNGLGIATLGPGLPEELPSIGWLDLLSLWRRPKNRRFRIWHARRNVEMVAGIIMRDLLRMKLRLIFTSAAQRHHKPFTKWLISKMDAVIATSQRSGSYLEVSHTVSLHGVDLEAFSPPQADDDNWEATGLPGKYAVGCFGRVRHQKGTDLFVQAMIDLLPQYPEWTAIITGRTTAEHRGFEQDLRKKISDAGLEDRILFMGEVDDIHPWYRRLSLYVAPSRNEGFGLTPLEAMASQTAVVASDAGAYEEMIVEGKTGSVVPAGDGDALREAIRPYLADPIRAKEHGQNALRHVRQEFALEREAAVILDVYEKIFNAK